MIDFLEFSDLCWESLCSLISLLGKTLWLSAKDASS